MTLINNVAACAPTHIYGEGYLADRRLVEELKRRSREVAQKFVDEIATAAEAAGVKCETVIGKAVVPHKGIIEAAEKNKCDAIFMATHSKTPVLVFR